MPTMPAAQATGLKQLQCDEIPIPDPEPGKVLVKTTLRFHLRLRPSHLLHGLERVRVAPAARLPQDTRASA